MERLMQNDISYAKVICDSVSPYGSRLTTLEVRFHRFVLAEFNTHRVFSRNSASSRAIPVAKMLDKARHETAFPISYPAEQKGMQGGEELEGEALHEAMELLREIHHHTVEKIQAYVDANPDTRLHKSVLNRPMEWFLPHTVIVSSTEWLNFFAQRCSPLAQPEIRVAAEKIQEALWESSPKMLKEGEWHMPYMSNQEIEDCYTFGLDPRQASAARCGRVSYLTQDGVRDPGLDVDMYARLIAADPPHWSPLEHVATPAMEIEQPLGNFSGWHQLRHWIANETPPLSE